MDKRKIKIAALSALCVLLSEFIFSALFGKENIVVGYLMSLAAISLLNKDFTLKPTSKTLELLILNLVLGLASYVVTLDIYIGLLINILVIFIVNYIYMTEMSSPTSYIFLMTYIVMWAKRIPIDRLPNRLLAVTFAVFMIMAIQVVFNRNTFKNKTNNLIKSLISDILEEIDLKIKSNKEEINDKKLKEKIRTLLTVINGSNHKMFYYSLEGKVMFNLLICLERINFLLNNCNELDEDILFELKTVLMEIMKLIDRKTSFASVIKELDKISELKKEEINSQDKALLKVCNILKITITNWSALKKKDLKRVDNEIELPIEFKIRGKLKREFKVDSLIFMYSAKLALVISISMFISDLLNLVYGKWLVLTIYVIMQPYVEDTVIKSKKRVKGTILGVLVFVLVFGILGEVVPTALVLFVALYFYFYYPAKDYDKKVMMLTIIALTSFIGVESMTILSITRILYIFIGVIVVWFINKYVFPYDINMSNEHLKSKYDRIIRILEKEVLEVASGKKEQEKLMKLVLLCNEVEEKLIMNNARANNTELDNYIKDRNSIMSDFRFIFLESYYINRGDIA